MRIPSWEVEVTSKSFEVIVIGSMQQAHQPSSRSSLPAKAGMLDMAVASLAQPA